MRTLGLPGIALSCVISSIGTAPAASARHAAWAPTGRLVAEGAVRMSGLDGRWRSTVDLVNGRFNTRADLGAYGVADIYDGRTRFRVDPSGAHHRLDSDFARAMARTEAWLARFGWLQAGYGGAVLSAPVKRNDGARMYLVRTATPVGGRPAVLWFDASTGDLSKTERRIWYTTVTTRYSDYRELGGQRLPFAIDDDDQAIRISRYTLNSAVPGASFAPPRQPDDASVPVAGTTVPAPIFPQLVVQASINGSAPMGFVFDTGGHSVLTTAAAEALGLKAVGEGASGGSGAETIAERDTSVKTLRIGDAVLRDQHFYVLPFGYANMEQGAKPPLAGLLGLEVLERFVVRINYRAGTLTLLPRDSAVTCRGIWQTARFTDDMPTVEGALDGIPAAFTIDTGNNGGLQIYDYWARRHGLNERYRHGLEAVSYGAGGASRNWLSYGRSFRMGGVTIPRPLVRTTDDKAGVAMSISEAGNLGTDLLANYTLTFDYARSRVCFEYVPGYVPLPVSRAGMRAIKIDPEVFAVTLVNPGSPAALAGLRNDDRIVAVDGRSARELGGGDLARIMAQPPGTRVMIDYIREGNHRRAEVILRNML